MQLDTARLIVDRYLACWNEPDPERRDQLVVETWTPDARSVDPLADVTGRAQISSMMGGIQAQMPGHRFSLVGDVNAHHDAIHWSWTMSTPDGEIVIAGVDSALIEDGRIALLTGFFLP